MTKERLYLFDTTLRDGAQTSGVDFSLNEKIVIAELLERLGVDYVEGGYPGANPTDTEFFSERRTRTATFTAFGMTKRAGRSAANDPGLQQVLSSGADACCFVAKAWDYHVRVALGCTNEENLDSIYETVIAAVNAGKEAMIDCEHFFDGFKANPDYALDCARTAYHAGARWIVLCDTNGGTLPDEIHDIVTKVQDVVPGTHLGIHTHDDTGHAVANSLAAVDAGVRQIQGTLNGLGERCGNANLITLIPTLKLKAAFADRFELGVNEAQLKDITAISHAFDEILNRSPDRQAPYVGETAFATKAGIHASAILKDPQTYEHVTPESVGNQRRVLVSDQAGKSNLLGELSRVGIEVDKSDPRLDQLAGQGQGAGVGRLCLRGGRCVLRIDGPPRTGRSAALFRRQFLPGDGRAPPQCHRGSGHGLRGRGQGRHRWRDAHVGGRGQRPGERARHGAQKGSRQVPVGDRGPRAD